MACQNKQTKKRTKTDIINKNHKTKKHEHTSKQTTKNKQKQKIGKTVEGGNKRVRGVELASEPEKERERGQL